MKIRIHRNSDKKCSVCGWLLRKDNKFLLCEEHRSHAKIPKAVDRTKKCAVCGDRLRTNNQIGCCRKHRRHSEVCKEREKKYRLNNIEHHMEVQREWYRGNRERANEVRRVYQARRIKTDINFKILKRLREHTSRSLKKTVGKGYHSTRELLGADLHIVRKYLEDKFQEDMSWDNYGKWHVDHVIPISSAKKRSDIFRLCHYTNLQPLWATDNHRKSNKMPQAVAQIKLGKV